MSNRVTIEQQEQMGIRQPSKYVPAKPVQTQALERWPQNEAPRLPQHNFDLTVTPTATTHVDMRTSAQDRAIGFIIASMPRTFAFSLAVTLLSIVVAGVTLAFSFVILFGVFSIVEIISYVYTLAISAEGTANYEARQKWNILKREQQERWNHYKQINRGDNNG